MDSQSCQELHARRAAAWLGFCLDNPHREYERAAAEILGVRDEQVTQTALLPVVYTSGTDFKPARRESLDAVVRRNTW
jgi:hypothetical protein